MTCIHTHKLQCVCLSTTLNVNTFIHSHESARDCRYDTHTHTDYRDWVHIFVEPLVHRQRYRRCPVAKINETERNDSRERAAR